MSRFKFYNANPVNNLVIDCTIRAISLLTDKTWTETHKAICEESRRQYNMPSSNVVWATYLKKLGYVKHTLPNTCPECYSVKDFCYDHPVGKFLLALDGHVVTVVDGYYYDTWDSGNETPLFYWRKEQ